jgi:predicted unusual protein kinase regulating ubiquinone biosynthesis (AarF/ABC1/UbiB family)
MYKIDIESLERIVVFIKEVIFIVKFLFIVFTESFLYLIFRNYSSFIDRITSRLASINILYVKVFQALALNNNLIDDNINNKLLNFTDNAPWNYSDINFADLIEVTNDYNLILKDGFDKPMNAGMISLVYNALQRETGEQVIIKMKRNNIDRKLNHAISNLQTFMYLLSFIPLVNKYQLAEVVNRNIDIIRHQTNFQEEVENMSKMKKNCKYLKYIQIPEANREITEKYPNIILMSFINGLKMNQILEEDYDAFAKLVMKFGFVTSIVHGFTHGDLHAGNILFINDNHDEKYPHKLGILDFGIAYEMEPEFKNIVFEIMTEMFTQEPLITSEKFLNSGILEPKSLYNFLPAEHYNNILKFTSEIINETIHSSKMANQIQIYKFLYKFKEYISNPEISDLGLRLSDNFVKTQLVLTMAHGVTLTLCKDDFMTLADKVLNELFHTKMIMEE